MMSYRFRRRSFLASLGGAFGFQLLLDNLEASAQGVTAPPRLLIVHWPRGTIRHHFVPTGSGTSYVAGRLLAPFEAVRSDTIAMYGLSHQGIDGGGGGPHQSGMVRTMTGANSPGTRAGDPLDACAGGPSWDQIFLKNYPGLSRRDANEMIVGRGYYNAAIDTTPVVSLRTISYGHERRSLTSSTATTITENTPLLPTLSPVTAYNDLFAGFGPDPDSAVRALRMKKSVLDSSLRELARVRELAPASERVKLDTHTEGIRKMEQDLLDRLAPFSTPMGCQRPPMPPSTQSPMPPSSQMREQTILAHAGILRAAFTCDLIRVATLQLGVAAHDAAADTVTDPNFFTGTPPAEGTSGYEVYESATNLSANYNRIMADIVATFRTQTDPLDTRGGSILDRTIIPFVTEVSSCGHALDGIGALVFGGRGLGMQSGQFQNLEASPRPHNNLWVTVAQAFLGSNPLAVLASEAFVKTGVTPIPGLWTLPM